MSRNEKIVGLLWGDRTVLANHLTLMGFVPLKPTSIDTATVAVGVANNRERTVMFYRARSRGLKHARSARSKDWTEISWGDITHEEMRHAYSIASREGWLS